MYACLVHFTFGAALLMDESAAGITAINALVFLVHWPPLAAACFLTAGCLALVGLGASDIPGGIFLMIPQQFILIVSAGGAIEAMVTGRFADGTVRSHWFLIADQSPAVVVAGTHTIAITRMWTRPWARNK